MPSKSSMASVGRCDQKGNKRGKSPQLAQQRSKAAPAEEDLKHQYPPENG